jgi:gliding motility-associated-like protein
MDKISIRILVLLLFYLASVTAQTVNTGELIIKPDTELATVANFNNTNSGNLTNDGTFYVYANFNNDGLVAFTPTLTTGFTYFKGAIGAQTISGTIVSELNNVRFENNHIQPAFLLSGDISVTGISDFYYGIVDNANNPGAIIFERNASHENTSNDSYVAGYVERNENNSFEFPIGDGGFFRPSAVGSTNLTSNIFRSRYFFKNSNALHPHNQKDPLIQIIDISEYWEFESNQAAVDAALTLSWNEDTTPSEITNENLGTELAIVRWDTTENKWKYYTTAVDTSNKTATAAIDNDGTFTLARVLINTSKDIVVHNGISPNGDGNNDYLQIDGLSNYPNNKLQVYNRWGVKVFETIGYGVNDNFFDGYSNGRATVKKNNLLPTGTYFYVLSYNISENNWNEKAGYIYIN